MQATKRKPRRKGRLHASALAGALAFGLVFLALGVESAADQPHDEVFVSSTGRQGAAGTEQDPATLEDVCQRELRPGTTVYLRGGDYFISPKSDPIIRWQGARDAPVIMRSFPGEWAKVDGGFTIKRAEFVVLRDFEMTHRGEYPRSGPQEKDRPEQADPQERGLENDVERSSRGALLSVERGESISLVNLYLHDNRTGNGIGAWDAARDVSVYGCIIVRNGWEDDVRGHGHGCYIQNGDRDGPDGTSRKDFIHNISALNMASGMKSYGNRPDVRRTYFIENVMFGNGLRSWTNGAPNFLAGSVSGTLDEIVLVGNHFFQPDGTTGDVGGAVYLGWGRGPKKSCIFTNNHVFGGGIAAVEISSWEDFTFRENVLYDEKRLVAISDSSDTIANWDWDENTYFDTDLNSLVTIGKQSLSAEDWKKRTSFDAEAKWIQGRPSGTSSHLIPNRFDPGRALLVVYNWDHHDTVELDLSSFLSKGRLYVIYNSLDYLGVPVGGGRFDGRPVKVKMRRTEKLGDEFQALVIHKTAAATVGEQTQP